MSKPQTITQYMKTYSFPPEKVRDASRALIIKGNKILLTYEQNTGVYMSPGGGVEPGETLEQCCIRELQEESGYVVKPTEQFITINEYSYETLYVSHYFLCEITGTCERSLTQDEIAHGAVPVWLDIDEAYEIFSTYADKEQDHMSLYMREYTVLGKLKNPQMKQVNFNNEILFAQGGESLSDVLMRHGKTVEHICGGRGVCKKCTVLVNGKEELSCRYTVNTDITVTTKEQSTPVSLAEEAAPCSGNICFVLDIGSTTLALALVDTNKKQIIKTVTKTNPQRTYGADVISRIEYCRRNSPKILQKVLTDAINNMIAGFGVCKVNTLYTSGNTAMLHLLLGKDCSKMGVAPYTPAFLEQQNIPAAKIGINKVEHIETLPCIAAFMGADITAGINLTGTPQNDKYNLLVDLGTNAEIVLTGKNGSVSTSAAAGPCFEGANISCGMSAVSGEIYSFKNGTPQTVNNAKPVGVCGTGLIEAIAFLLEKGIIDRTGYMPCEQFEAAEGIYITQDDIRQYQLAKSAVYSAIASLVKYNAITFDNIETVYISGGFSEMLDVDSAVKTGLLPAELKNKCVCINNSSLLGTVKYACEKNDVKTLAEKTKYIDLSADAFFADLFIENMMF